MIVLTSIYFTVTGIQFKATEYLKLTLNSSEKFANYSFIFVIIICLISGVITGGFTLDYFGGIRHKNSYIIMTIFISLSVVFGILFTVCTNQWIFVILLGFTLFFGSAFLPVTMNKHLEHVSSEYKTTANSFTLFFTNIFGFFPPNLV